MVDTGERQPVQILCKKEHRVSRPVLLLQAGHQHQHFSLMISLTTNAHPSSPLFACPPANPALPSLLCPALMCACPQMVLLLREVYRGFSARSDRVVPPGGDKGLMRSTADLHFTRWDRSKAATADNLVLLTAEEAEQHDAVGLQQLQQQEPEFVAKVERLLDHVRAQMCY